MGMCMMRAAVNTFTEIFLKMKPSEVFQSHREAIRRVVESHRTRNPRLFGSVLHGEDSGESDSICW